MTTKRPSLKERAFEKLGFGQRFRSNTEGSEQGHNAEDDHSRTVWYTPSMETEKSGEITASLNKPISSIAVTGITSASVAPGVTTPAQILESESDTHSTSQFTTKHRRSKPDGTWEYHVKDSDTLESIAAFWDTTPSELKKLNKLTSRLIFSGQVLFIPDLVKPEEQTKSSPPRVGSPDRPSLRMDIPLIKMSEKPLAKVPGHAERQTPVSSPKQDAEFEIPHKLSEDEAKELDQECYERFIKLNVKHITDGQGVVSGVLLVTPNAVMFDPNVSDPLVLEHGAERYGVIAPMDMIVSAAMYHDIAAMGQHNADRSPTSKPKPEVYHDRSCPLYRSWCEGHGAEFITQDAPTTVAHQPSRSGTITSQMSEAESMCSCGAGTESTDKSPMQMDKSPVSLGPLQDEKTVDRSPLFGDKTSVQNDQNQTGDEVTRPYSNSLDEFGDFQSAEETVQGQVTQANNSHSDTQNSVTRDEVTGGLGADVESVVNREKSSDSSIVVSQNTDGQVDRLETSDISVTTHDKNNSQKVESGSCEIEPSDKKTAFYLGEGDITLSECLGTNKTVLEQEHSQPQNNGEMRIGSIVYLPVSENNQDESSVKAMEALSKLSLDQFDKHEHSESPPMEVPGGSDKNVSTDPKLSNSFGSFNMSPHLSAFVNYATGLFKAGSDVKDITEVVTGDEDKPVDITDEKLPAPKVRDIGVENAITLADKPELFQSFDELIPRPAATSEDLPLYLCLRLGMPVNKEVSQTCPIQAYSKGRKKPEYWFSIPREKVDHLYAFFVQWTPEIYGGDEDSAEKRGFVVLEEEDDNSDDDKLEILEEYFSNGMAALHKDWEVIDLPPPNLSHIKHSPYTHTQDTESRSQNLGIGGEGSSSQHSQHLLQFCNNHCFASAVSHFPCSVQNLKEQERGQNESVIDDGIEVAGQCKKFEVMRRWDAAKGAVHFDSKVAEIDEDSDDELLFMDEYFADSDDKTGHCRYLKDNGPLIISADEAFKRKSLSETEDSMVLPELIGQTSVLEEGYIYLISRFLPPRTIGYPWTLVYSSDRHGFSLRTLYRDMHGIDSPILLVVKDTDDNVFGALTSCAFKVSEHFYGTGESFLFTFCPEFKVFRWTGDNNFFIKGNQESLSIGAGQGKFGLWFDEDLYHGRTNRCETYDNDLLTDSEDFVVKIFEAWAFTMD